MKSIRLSLVSLAAAAQLLCALPASAQTGPAPYGAPISLEQAKAMAAAEAERAEQWQVVISIVDAGGHWWRCSGWKRRPPASTSPSARRPRPHRSADRARRWKTAGPGGSALRILAVRGATPLQGGVPIGVDGKIIGAIGVSGVQASQDEQVAMAGAAAVTAK
jgi:uncharacterized protein GlcG (DUF336 family)